MAEQLANDPLAPPPLPSVAPAAEEVGHTTPAPTESLKPDDKIEKPTEAPVIAEIKPAEDIIMADVPKSTPTTTTPAEAPIESGASKANDPPVLVAKEPEVAVPAVATPATTQDVIIEDAPDPDEDDLDDLDDVLDEFSATRIDTLPAAPSASGPGRPADVPSNKAIATEAEVASPDDDFAKELQKGMADLLGELESSPEMQKQFEDMIRELGKTAPGDEQETGVPGLPGLAGLPGLGAERAAGSASASEAAKGEASFQETIRKTMERMQESGEAAGAAASTAAASEDDFMASLLKEMEAGGSEEDFSKMLLGMMEQLTNKEILYEPMKELDNKFPDWMKKNGDKTPAADMTRYCEQQRLVREIVAKFEEPGYTDENVQSREYILERMQKMQGEGSPPADLVGDMDVATEALGELDAGCPTQ